MDEIVYKIHEDLVNHQGLIRVLMLIQIGKNDNLSTHEYGDLILFFERDFIGDVSPDSDELVYYEGVEEIMEHIEEFDNIINVEFS